MCVYCPLHIMMNVLIIASINKWASFRLTGLLCMNSDINGDEEGFSDD